VRVDPLLGEETHGFDKSLPVFAARRRGDPGDFLIAFGDRLDAPRTERSPDALVAQDEVSDRNQGETDQYTDGETFHSTTLEPRAIPFSGEPTATADRIPRGG